MQDAPVLVLSDNQELVDLLVQNLKARGLSAFGTTSLREAIRSLTLLQPKIVVMDPTSEKCFELLDDRSGGWKSLTIVAIAESKSSAERAREMGIDDVIMSNDSKAVVKAVLDLVHH